MAERHRMVVEREAYGEWLLACPYCPRRLVLSPNGYTSLDNGDWSAQHYWSSPGISMGPVTVEQA